MIKMVLQDFFSTRKQAFREGWKNAGHSWMGVWFVISFIVNIWTDEEEVNMSVGIFLTVEFLVFWCAFLMHAMYPNRLTKLMFLVPVDKEEKKEYLKIAYLFKGLTASGVQILVMLIFVLQEQILPEYALLSVFSFFMLHLIEGLENFYGQFHLITRDGSIGSYKMEWCVRWFSSIVFVFLIVSGTGILWRESLTVCIIGIIIQTMLCICVVAKRYKEQMENALEWEKIQYQKGEQGL